ncbi:MAG: sodium-dependent transporter, partial [Congregibacter sp.]|nr:sodium-dependent transporter [Congregibacter sp.]
MAQARGEFSSRFGFIMAAAGSAVGLGNIWGFPTQAASNGGAAFLIVYLILAFVLAYPALMAELVLGRHAHANAVTALKGTSTNSIIQSIGAGAGIIGFVVASLILSFYAIVAGWMIAHCFASVAALLGSDDLARWLVEFSLLRNVLFMALFMVLTVAIISAGVRDGIERWSSRLMPLLLITLFGLVAYVLTLDGASEGVRVYLMPDFESALSPQLIIKALGSAFFSLSLGVGTMLIYGSYISDNENLPVAGGLVTAVDIGIAVLAGFLVLPAMYVALNNGVDIFAADGSLLS